MRDISEGQKSCLTNYFSRHFFRSLNVCLIAHISYYKNAAE
jgi:hypothetical protein